MAVVEIVLLGFAAGVLSGLFGVGGGVLFVPTLALVLGMTQVRAEATSLLAIVPVALVGAWRQAGYGNARVGRGLTVGLMAVGGGVVGVVLANILSGRVLEVAFAGLSFLVAAQFVRRGLAANR